MSICPHCNAKVYSPSYSTTSAGGVQLLMLYCRECKKILGFAKAN